MSTDLYYFSGTGNSLHTVVKLGELLAHPTRRIAVKELLDQKEIVTGSDIVILVFPVYFMSIPAIIVSFVKKLKFANPAPSIYAIATCNGVPGHSLYTLNRLLEKKRHKLKAGFALSMPGNSVIVRDYTNPPDIRAQRLADSDRKLMEISAFIRQKRSGSIDGSKRMKYYLKGIVTGTVAKYIYRTPSKFRISDCCTKCGICTGVCPRSNIRLGDAGPNWGNRCEHCLACFHWCPKMAVELGRHTTGKLRYHHPEISVSQMLKK